MGRLSWIEDIDGWHAGPYHIELAASQLWVCTRRLNNGDVIVEETSGSLRALKGSVERMEKRRGDARRALGYTVSFLLALALPAMSAATGSSLTPLLILLCSGLALFSILKAVDCVIARSWEALPLNYQ